MYFVICLVRRASSRDIDAITEVINKSNYEAYKNIIPSKYFKHPFVNSEYISSIFNKWFIYVAEVNGKIVGCVCLEVNNDIGIIHHFYVLPEFQRKGIGSKLLAEMEMDAVGLGVREIRVYVDSKAYWAISFYSKSGYEVNGLYRHVISEDYHFLELVLCKKLSYTL